MNINASRQVGFNAIFLLEMEVVLNLEIITSSIYRYNIWMSVQLRVAVGREEVLIHGVTIIL